ncbi:MAG TPA: NAD-dependent deacylase [Candidatus Polarisedimenticolaceae bacterium]|nr:NAD-dependent deacylase [Candidatus Polarisedimenticolaceae bacterium]
MEQPAPTPRLVELLRASGPLLVLTGAGVSRESGIATFRDAGGLWEGVDPTEVATPGAFARDPLRVWRFYDERRARAAEVQPNAAHHAIAALERTGRPFLLATQNVDGLHERAGSASLVRLHGSLWRVRCTREGNEREDLSPSLAPLPPRCVCGALLRPAVVWFEEPLPAREFQDAAAFARRAELVLVVGTSSLVYPAASLPLIARDAGAYVVEVNPERTPLTPDAHEHLEGPAGTVLPALLAAAA